MNHKICSACKIERHINEFNKKGNNKDGYQSKCKLCQKKYSHEYDLKRKYKFDYSDSFYKENKKVCSRCGIEKCLLEFTRDSKGTYGLKPHCNECRKPYYGNLKNDSYDPSVYNIIHKITGEVLYVGETEVPELRKDNHFCGYSNSPISNLISTGELHPDNLLFEIIERVEDKTKRLERETYWIKQKNPKHNIKKI